jgi:hypothetical protein
MKEIKTIAKDIPYIDKILCNKCGKEVWDSTTSLEDKIEGRTEEYFEGNHHWGYFSKRDGELHQFDLCQECYGELIDSFKIPVHKTNLFI